MGELNEDIIPGIERAMADVEGVAAKNKMVKQSDDSLSKALDAMKDLSEDLKQTEELSTDAETVAHDALASIDARHQVIKDSIVTGRTLLDDNTAIKMAMEATEKALVDLQKERPKRDADPDDDDVGGRLDV